MSKNNLFKAKTREIYLTSAVFLIPAIFFLSVFIIYSLFDSFTLSFYKWNGIDPIKKFIGLNNWLNLINDPAFIKAFANNMKIVVLSLFTQLPLGMALAAMLDIGGKKLNFLKVVYFIPMLMSSVAIGFLFKYFYDPNLGLFSAILQFFGLNSVDFLGNGKIALYAIVIVISWQFVPFYMVYFLAGLSSMSEEIREASYIDGATYKEYFFQIVLPMQKGNIRNAAILSMVGSLKYFDLVYVMTGGGPNGATELMATYMYKNAFNSLKMGYGAAIATAMFIIISIISICSYTFLNRKEDF